MANDLGLPPKADVVVEVRFEGLISSPTFKVSLIWKRPNGQNIVDVERIGAWLRFGGAWRRLPDTLFAMAAAIDRVGAAGDKIADRLAAIAMLREALPFAEADGIANPQGLVGTLCKVLGIADASDVAAKQLRETGTSGVELIDPIGRLQ